MSSSASKRPSSGTGSAQGNKIGTRTRILETARQLFNDNGVHETAVLTIAKEMGISPGNVTYHFKSKFDIVRELAQTLRSEVSIAISMLKLPHKPVDVISQVERVLRQLWSYRFMFNSAVHVSRIDQDLANLLQVLQTTIRDILTANFKATILRGEMRSPQVEDGVDLLCDNLLAVWLQWLKTESIQNIGRQEPSNAALLACMRHHFSLIDPYVSRSFSEESWTEIQKRYGNRAVSAHRLGSMPCKIPSRGTLA